MTVNHDCNQDNFLTKFGTSFNKYTDKRIVIRCAAVDDVPVILKLIHQKAEYDGCPDLVTATAEHLHADLFGAKRSEIVLLVEIEDTIAGFATYYFTYSSFLSKPGIWLDDLYLRPEFRGQGIGQTLMQQLCYIAQQSGCERMDWTVATRNDRGIKFYQKMGATIIETVRLCRLDKQAIARQAKETPGVHS
ncbi:GNAT family N-acetyltransferase [Thermocoleostomius sinensis]|uniref:GNAT family N-acetyltransferase n=1 Tax=Thermocoleostomius sinensis A174 TaxID=2016057 RepID=A0A9E9CCE4_9CYAN|nr:GNAT family N-acetyltransferase [Thermocoleostomius sinensis]WAL62705.1 GNAT family N-acetyltransferase [Thermocoleostomius sinensis A174]